MPEGDTIFRTAVTQMPSNGWMSHNCQPALSSQAGCLPANTKAFVTHLPISPSRQMLPRPSIRGCE